MFYYQFNIGDYATHTRHLSIYADLAYRRLLDWYYLNEKPIPINPQQAAKLILMKNRFHDVEEVLKEFFQLTENGWINKRADAEISKYKEFSDAGKRGAAKRWSKGGDSPPIAPPIANNNHKPINNKQETINNKPSLKPLSEYSDDFLLFWSNYPKKVGKDKAWALWQKYKPNIEQVMYTLSWQRVSEQWISNYIPNPETYLNQGRWKDEPMMPSEHKPKQTKFEAQVEFMGKLFGKDKQNGNDRQIIDVTNYRTIEGNGTGIPEIGNGIRESDGS